MDSRIAFQRILVAVICSLAAVLVVIIFNVLPDKPPFEDVGRIAVGKMDDGKGGAKPGIMTIQNLTWIAFFIGIGELWLRFQWSRDESAEIARGYLPEDGQTILVADDLPEVMSRVQRHQATHLFLPQLIRRICFQFQSSRSVSQANDLLNSSLELFLHEVDLRYNITRYLVWLIPTLGFIGTVMGISNAMLVVKRKPTDPDLGETVSELAVAFDTTFLALILAGVLVFLMNVIQGKEEGALNRASQYCLDNLINRLFEGR
jgi:biopolymer transport protein ExbB/TolQ